jgi:hypothetical protein
MTKRNDRRRHARLYAGHPRLYIAKQDGDGRNKFGHVDALWGSPHLVMPALVAGIHVLT